MARPYTKQPKLEKENFEVTETASDVEVQEISDVKVRKVSDIEKYATDNGNGFYGEIKLFCKETGNCDIRAIVNNHPVPVINKCLRCSSLGVYFDVGGQSDL